MHPDLMTPETAAQRLVHDVMVHVVRKPGTLRLVRALIPEGWDVGLVKRHMDAALVDKGLFGVHVHLDHTEGEPRLLSVLIDR